MLRIDAADPKSEIGLPLTVVVVPLASHARWLPFVAFKDVRRRKTELGGGSWRLVTFLFSLATV